MSSDKVEFILWRKLYQLASGTFYNENSDVVKRRILDVAKEIEIGFLALKKPKTDASEQLDKMLKEKHQERVIPFLQKLYQYLDLDVNQTYDIFCNYLVNEYRGPAKSLENFMSSESLMIKLLNDIWSYYSLERMVMLKFVKCIVEFFKSPDHPYHSAYKAVLTQIGIGKLRKSYIDQLDALVKETKSVLYHHGDILNSQQKLQMWEERKYREINEVIQIVMICSHYEKLTVDEMKKLIELFKFHSFGKQAQFLSSTNPCHAELMQQVTYNEISLLMTTFSTSDPESLQWMTDVIGQLDTEISAMHQYAEHSPILLSWMLFKFLARSNETSTEHYAVYGKLGSRAVQLNVYEFLLKMINHKMFKDNSLCSKIVLRCIYDNLSFLCELFNADGSIAHQPKILDLFGELLASPAIARDFCKNDDNPIRSLFNAALEKFPVDFVQCTRIANSLATASKQSHSWIVEFVQNLPVYTERPDDPHYELRKVYGSEDEDTYVIQTDYQPFRRIDDFVISAGTNAIVREEKGKFSVHFLIATNYFNVLHNEMNEFIASINNFTEIDESRIVRLEEGISFLVSVLKKLEAPEQITNQMIHPTELVFDILSKMKNFSHPRMKLMAVCIDACTELLPFFADEIFRRFITLNIVPSVTQIHGDFRSYSIGNGFESGLIGYYLINFEKITGRYDVLKAYLNFLQTFATLKRDNVYTIELPGILFLMREILVHINDWRFDNEQDKIEITIFVLEFLHDVLTIPKDVVKRDAARSLLRNIAVFSLLHLEPSAALLKLVSLGNPVLLSNFVENESNWFIASDSNLNRVVLNSMRILMQILKMKELSQSLSPLEQLIYTQPKQRDTYKIIPIVANYTNYPFNRRFAVLSCRLLRRFAIEFQSSLAACLDMEPDQIRMMFLNRLRDDLESEELKIAVLDFVNACIDKQPGLTEAFFKVSYENEVAKSILKKPKDTANMCDGILTYMETYLETVAKDPSSTKNEQLKRIMSLFHALWKQGWQSLVEVLVKKENFWSSFCSPLFEPITGYQFSQLFNILGIELFKMRDVKDVDENLRKVLNRFLEEEKLSRWLDIVYEIPNAHEHDESTSANLDEVPEWLSRLQSFKDFLVLLLRKKKFFTIKNDSNKLLLERSLSALVKSSQNLEVGNDMRPFVVLSEIYLILLNGQKSRFTETQAEDLKLLESVEKLLQSITTCYEDIHPRAKDAILAIAVKTLELESDELKRHEQIASNFILCDIEMLCFEFVAIENAKSEKEEKRFSLVLVIALLRKLLLLNENETISANWNGLFTQQKVFNRLVHVTSLICQDFSKKSTTAELLELLVMFAKGNHSRELLFCDMSDYLWMKLLPPRELTEMNLNADKKSHDIWTPQEWWQIYARGVQLVKLMLETHRYLFIKDALFFVGIHEECFNECLILVKTCLEPSAVKIIKFILELLNEVIQYENCWRTDYYQSIMSLMKHIQGLLNSSISLLQRPKILKRLTESSKPALEEYPDSILTDPSEELIKSMNELIEIITLCCNGLLRFSPDLMNLICDTEYDSCKWMPILETQFGLPQINPSEKQLNFGSILSIVALLVKILNLQHFKFNHTPLTNFEGDHDGAQTVTMLSVNESTHLRALDTSPTRQFSRSSASVTSSMVQASNELLSHLDTKSCVIALELILTLLASQTLLALKSDKLSIRDKQMIRRDLSNELHCVHDFVKKKILSGLKIDIDDPSRAALCRNKFGQQAIVNDVQEITAHASTSKSSQPRRSQDLRSQVVRKLHLQQKTYEIPTNLSPIQGSMRGGQLDSTPVRGAGNPTSSTAIKRVGFDKSALEKVWIIEDDDEPFVVNPGDPAFTGLSTVKLVEEDYLHLLSNLFAFICQSDN